LSPTRLIFINRYFYPDHSATSELLSDLAFYLSDNGCRVTVITSRLSYDNKKQMLLRHELVRGVEVWRVWSFAVGRFGIWGKLLDYVTFYVAAGWKLARIVNGGEVVIAKTDPPLLSVVTALIVSRSVKLINWHQDVFPEVAEKLDLGGSVGRPALRVLRGIRDYFLARATLHVVVGNRMAQKFQQMGIAHDSIRMIPNWANGELVHPQKWSASSFRSSLGFSDDDIVVGYAGNLGRAHEIETLIGAMKQLDRVERSRSANGSPAIKFMIGGGGVLRGPLEQEVRKAALRNVRFHDYLPRECLADVLCSADIQLVILDPRLEGLIVPSKFYAIAAAGRPVIFIGDQRGEIAELVDEAGCGVVVTSGDISGLVDSILKLAAAPELRGNMGARARMTFERKWDRSIALAKWKEVVDEVVSFKSECAGIPQN
jgi:colanic acid biosynthesis glycosyl transferase WcaI